MTRATKIKNFSKKFWSFQKKSYLCSPKPFLRELSSAGLEHLPYKQRVGGSNPSAPTRQKRLKFNRFFCCICPVRGLESRFPLKKRQTAREAVFFCGSNSSSNHHSVFNFHTPFGQSSAKKKASYPAFFYSCHPFRIVECTYTLIEVFRGGAIPKYDTGPSLG